MQYTYSVLDPNSWQIKSSIDLYLRLRRDLLEKILQYQYQEMSKNPTKRQVALRSIIIRDIHDKHRKLSHLRVQIVSALSKGENSVVFHYPDKNWNIVLYILVFSFILAFFYIAYNDLLPGGEEVKTHINFNVGELLAQGAIGLGVLFAARTYARSQTKENQGLPPLPSVEAIE